MPVNLSKVKPVNLSKDDFCGYCRLWRIIRPAAYIGQWGDGTPVSLCKSDAFGWDSRVIRKENAK